MSVFGVLGTVILSTVFIFVFKYSRSFSPEMETLRVTLSTFGEGVSVAAILCSVTHANELIPTSFRYKISGILKEANMDFSNSLRLTQ